MPQGLQVWDAAGNLIVDTNTLIYKEFQVQNVTVDGDLNIAAVDGTAPTVVAVTPQATSPGLSVEVDPADNKVRWNFDGGNGNARIRVALL